MKIKVVTVGKLKEKYLKDGIAEYSKRISRFAKLEMIELADEKHQIRPVNQRKSKDFRNRRSENFIKSW